MSCIIIETIIWEKIFSYDSKTSTKIYNEYLTTIKKRRVSDNFFLGSTLNLEITNLILKNFRFFFYRVHVTFIKPDGEKIKVKANIGDNLLDVVVNHDLDFDGYGACEGTLTCSTCHVILKQEDYDKVPDKPTEDEMDMLDLAFELTDTSRLGCQVVLTKEMDGIEVKVPATINDVRNSR